MKSNQKRKWASTKRHRQQRRHLGTTIQGETPLDILRHFLPEASSDALAALRREPERLSFWQRLRVFFTG